MFDKIPSQGKNIVPHHIRPKFCKEVFSIIPYHFYLLLIFQNNARWTFSLTLGLSRKRGEEGQRIP